MRILVLNCGSTSLKLKLFAMPHEQVLAEGAIDRLGSDRSRVRLVARGKGGATEERVLAQPVADHHQGISLMLALLEQTGAKGPEVVAHKLAHGGERFTGAVRLDREVLEAVRALNPLAPLHNPPMLRGVEVCAQLLPGIPQYGV
ncbi:MAG: acetate kinase, partial [Armatimonadota bacterium]|nr:acetate kinase [Armatimonadota bacterium]